MTKGVTNGVSVYIHIPYCVSKCHYCDFNSYGLGKHPAPEAEYVAALKREFDGVGRILAEREWTAPTVYFGGGTPSLLAPEAIDAILRAVAGRFFFSPLTEITLEMNPKTASLEKMRALRAIGVNRLSVGVQSLDEEILSRLGRAHSSRDALQTLEWAFAAGWEQVNADLMYGLPQQSLAHVASTLDQLADFPLRHLSAYELIVEEGTPFYDRYLEGRLPLPEVPEVLAMRDAVSGFAHDKGMEFYEISNYAAPGFESVHNGHYWNYDSFLGIGAGAVSFLRWEELAPVLREKFPSKHAEPPYGLRWTNPKLPSEYSRSCEPSATAFELITRREAMGEFMMMGLRRHRGVRFADFRKKFGEDPPSEFLAAVERARSRGLLQEDPEGCRLTETGMLLSNEVLQAFL
jgi:oxygen-independent coproporphyrinogen-3 oxidase